MHLPREIVSQNVGSGLFTLIQMNSDSPPSSFGQLWNLGRHRDHPNELASLKQLAALAATAGHLVLRRADRLFGPPCCFHRHQIPVAPRSHEAQQPVFLVELDQNATSTGT